MEEGLIGGKAESGRRELRIGTGPAGHGRHDRDSLVCFPFEGESQRLADPAVFKEKFQPELRLPASSDAALRAAMQAGSFHSTRLPPEQYLRALKQTRRRNASAKPRECEQPQTSQTGAFASRRRLLRPAVLEVARRAGCPALRTSSGALETLR